MNLDFLNDLNQSQLEAVKYLDGPSLVIAGAGSGKTRVLTYKIAYLLALGVKPWNILALTFTNKAAREMKERIALLVGEELSLQLHMGTFHSIFAQILRREAKKIGYFSNFTIYDENDSTSLLKAIIKEKNLDDKYKPSTVRSRISNAKNHLILPSDCGSSFKGSFNTLPLIPEIYSLYQERLERANAMDFDDLLINTYLLFSSYEDVRKKYASHFHFVLVDEYQDTNKVQKEILWQLTLESQKVCVVGDDAQSIYAFRGANIDNILGFQDLYTNTALFKLERNYRSTQSIVNAANSLIKHNQKQIEKTVYSENEKGEKLVVKQAFSDREEAIIVSSEIMKMVKHDGLSYSDIAILYRRNHLSRGFEENMAKLGIPYRVYGGLAFYQRKEIKDVLSYFRLVVNSNDEEAFKRIINYPKRGIGDTTVSKILSAIPSSPEGLWKIVAFPEEFSLGLSKAIVKKLQDFYCLIEGFKEKLEEEDAYTLAKEIVKLSGISIDVQKDDSPENVSRKENIEELLNSINDFVGTQKEESPLEGYHLQDYLREVSLQTDADRNQGDEKEKVSIMTMHSAKGLEFPIVFIVGLEEEIFPDARMVNSPRLLEEERRLFYVAITRAKKKCILSYALNRYSFGFMEMQTPSRFINDIDKKYVIFENAQKEDTYTKVVSNKPSFNQKSKIKHQEKPFDFWKKPQENFSHTKNAINNTKNKESKIENVNNGDVIEHERFGLGEVIAIEGNGENTKATIKFKNLGTKQIMLKFARIKIIHKNKD